MATTITAGAIAAIAAAHGDDLTLAAHEGQAYDREEHRDSKKQRTIHVFNPPNLQVPVSKQCCRSSIASPRDGAARGKHPGLPVMPTSTFRHGCPVI